jgi:hypothetical protein
MQAHEHAGLAGQATPIPDDKTFHTIAAKFALKGHALHRTTRADDGRVTFIATNWGQSRAFSTWHDVLSFLTQIGGAA